MKKLDEMNCIACRGGDPPASKAERDFYFPQIPDWQIVQVDGQERLEKTFKFKKYLEAVDFTSKIGRWAEKQDHHPAILLEWGKVTVTWWTHVVDGLHQNDFVSAAKSDTFYLDY
ncbi:MAG: 4a-hydroxytetrahydrobiopterin dehydratase [Chloroflexi bacterium]|nr:4a-hydroxytetrahydrobiopterin dehydratase [Chloroflexota bacterium]MBT3670865.1 4a-hydroxytetrahydrobiopterin dehydratase [Chloroflexota bacterium]MBT4003683.1 4a-hydroxytetrahydrobiopterin dehydratase [Chloroflexota bacterium]MBT4305178.1 4a-hydroxytetrahydrobiopterin dehydratase [Chloroflexota bacterium]MBT4534577.1 4a-hydroxytetrahydrobiopterin dehydratase [Chloroflexota bacterium]